MKIFYKKITQMVSQMGSCIEKWDIRLDGQNILSTMNGGNNYFPIWVT
jgi:hypothetical protein